MGYNDHIGDVPDNTILCTHCGKRYIQWTEEQTPGCRSMDEDICPYSEDENYSDMT